MGAKTGIEWTDATWNPIRGCSRVSEGCRHCYAETMASRFSGEGQAYSGLAVMQNGKPHWTGKIEFVEEHLLDPLKWGPVIEHTLDCEAQWAARLPVRAACECAAATGITDVHLGECSEAWSRVVGKHNRRNRKCACPSRARRIFVNSMSDLFHDNVTDEMRDKIFAVMALCPQHVFQVLTKRPARMLEYLGAERAWHRIKVESEFMAQSRKMPIDRSAHRSGDWLAHILLGVSVENQKAANDRLDYLCLLAEEGWRTMVSFEPLLSDVDPGLWWLSLGAKTWAIVGGESGPGAREMQADWARNLRDQCVLAGVPFFFKQWGEYLPPMTDGGYDLSGTRVLNASDGPVRVGKHAAGALLDGREWKQFPEVAR